MRRRFRQWIRDTAAADYGRAWLLDRFRSVLVALLVVAAPTVPVQVWSRRSGGLGSLLRTGPLSCPESVTTLVLVPLTVLELGTPWRPRSRRGAGEGPNLPA